MVISPLICLVISIIHWCKLKWLGNANFDILFWYLADALRLQVCVHPHLSTLPTELPVRPDPGQTLGAIALWNNRPKRNVKFKFRKNSFVQNLLYIYQIVLIFCTKHGSFTAVLCAKFQSDMTIEMEVIDQRDLKRFEVKMSFGWMSFIATDPDRYNPTCCWDDVKPKHEALYPTKLMPLIMMQYAILNEMHSLTLSNRIYWKWFGEYVCSFIFQRSQLLCMLRKGVDVAPEDQDLWLTGCQDCAPEFDLNLSGV